MPVGRPYKATGQRHASIIIETSPRGKGLMKGMPRRRYRRLPCRHRSGSCVQSRRTGFGSVGWKPEKKLLAAFQA